MYETFFSLPVVVSFLAYEVVKSARNFIFIFILYFAVLSICLSAVGLDFITAVSGAATALANVGPGLGPVIGPAGNFSTLPGAAKWLLSAGMLLGRLEFLSSAEHTSELQSLMRT